LFVGLCAGGAASLPGTVVGAMFIEFVPNFAEKISKAAPGAIYGVILIAMLFLMPMGAGGFLVQQWRKLIGSGAAPARPPALGQDSGVGVNLVGSLRRADKIHASRADGVEP
jgi:branched-chain amino acid transport system permease protein